jgi:hypothetical protein
MNKRNKKSLRLDRQTIRQLTGGNLTAVHGGRMRAGGECCEPGTGPGCSNTDWSKQQGCPSECNCP